METPRRMLDEISTRWPLIHDPAQFVLRYAPAIESYLLAVVRDPDRVEEIRQDFLLRVVQKGFGPEGNVKGRFRHYLKAAVRNAAMSHLRRKEPAQADAEELAQVAESGPSPTAGDDAWLQQWRTCLLNRVWDAVELVERHNAGNYAHAVLRMYVERHAEETSQAMAKRLSQQLGKPFGAEAFRKQLSRARRLFAQLLVYEVAQTVEGGAADAIEEELIELGLLADVQGFLPKDYWRTRPK